MKKTLATLLASAIALSAAAETTSTNEPLKVLSIGNSFSVNAHRYLSDITESMGDKIILGNAVIGGCPLSLHWNNAASNNVSYKYNGQPVSLKKYLEAEDWDFVTIQQASGYSRFPESYEPHGTNLIAFIKEHAPKAEILVHQTWAYRQDESRIKKWGITTDEMHAGVAKAYKDFANNHGLRIIPAGEAIQLARKEYGWDTYTPENKEAGEPAKGRTLLSNDGYHANNSGEFLIGCVWYEFLFDKDVRPSTFIPQNVSPEDGAQLREIAHKIIHE